MFKDNIKRLLEENNMSQEELGRMVGLKQAAISTYVRGIHYPTIPTLEKMAKIFGTTCDELLKDEKRPPTQVNP
jgi:transcriptional regulator with XRE-family HTH domain